MSSRYEPKDHIQRLEIAPRAEGILEQREVTIQSYQTTVAFDYKALDAGLANAWLTPMIRFGVFSRVHILGTEALNIVLGLQEELTIRAYDYDERRPLWFSWQNAIVDTVNVHYFAASMGYSVLRLRAEADASPMIGCMNSTPLFLAFPRMP